MKSLNFKNKGIRITYIRGTMSKAAFARELGVSPSYIGMLEEGKNEPSDTLSELICLKFNINKDWLLTGEGEPERKKDVVSESGIHYNRCSADPELSEIVDILQHDLPEAKKIILKLLKGRKEFKEGINALQTVDNNLLKEEEGT